mmetsp:Transcript_26026/g.30227  ORF Transcript_26026/g.30227 Transcript_26026/m.30227 type:complete len:109 (+) Transcript_26026:742-1068(+)
MQNFLSLARSSDDELSDNSFTNCNPIICMSYPYICTTLWRNRTNQQNKESKPSICTNNNITLYNLIDSQIYELCTGVTSDGGQMYDTRFRRNFFMINSFKLSSHRIIA